MDLHRPWLDPCRTSRFQTSDSPQELYVLKWLSPHRNSSCIRAGTLRGLLQEPLIPMWLRDYRISWLTSSLCVPGSSVYRTCGDDSDPLASPEIGDHSGQIRATVKIQSCDSDRNLILNPIRGALRLATQTLHRLLGGGGCDLRPGAPGGRWKTPPLTRTFLGRARLLARIRILKLRLATREPPEAI